MTTSSAFFFLSSSASIWLRSLCFLRSSAPLSSLWSSSSSSLSSSLLSLLLSLWLSSSSSSLANPPISQKHYPNSWSEVCTCCLFLSLVFLCTCCCFFVPVVFSWCPPCSRQNLPSLVESLTVMLRKFERIGKKESAGINVIWIIWWGYVTLSNIAQIIISQKSIRVAVDVQHVNLFDIDVIRWK